MKATTWIIVVLSLLVMIWLAVRANQNPNRSVAHVDPSIYFGLRNMMLQGSRAKFGIPATAKATDPYGVLMDWGMKAGTATVVAIADGTASVYLSSGGGFIGGGQSHESMRAAAKKTVELANEVQPLMHQTTTYPLPQRGQVAFYVLTDAGVFTASASDEEMRNHTSPYYKLGDSAQTIVTEYRLSQQGNKRHSNQTAPVSDGW
jgi:hypothetical protein